MKFIKILKTFLFHIYKSFDTEAIVETIVVFFCWKTIVLFNSGKI